jgi:hypothetical protein
LRSDELSHEPRGDNGRLRRDLPLVTISPGSGDSHEDRVMHLVFKKFDTLGSYIAENIKKIEE